MAIIVVGGSNRGVGKTTLVCALIAALPEYRWNAVKITTHDHRQPVSPGLANAVEGSTSGRIYEFRTPFLRQLFEKGTGTRAGKQEPAPTGSPIWEETTPGEETDTGRYLSAGAAHALLVTAPDGELSEPLNRLWPRFGRGTNLIFESNSVVHHVRADVCLLIHGVAERALPLPERKPSFVAAVRHSDALVAHASTDRLIQEGVRLAGQEADTDEAPAPKPIFHLQSLERISPALMEWLRLRLPSPQQL